MSSLYKARRIVILKEDSNGNFLGAGNVPCPQAEFLMTLRKFITSKRLSHDKESRSLVSPIVKCPLMKKRLKYDM